MHPSSLVSLLLLWCCTLLIDTSWTFTIKDSNEENSWHLMCEMLHKDQFVFDASIAAFGCRLNCVVLMSSTTTSGDNNKAFFDKSSIFEHNLNDGIYCKRDHICKGGNCTLEYSSVAKDNANKKGVVVVEILEAKLPRKDTMTASDGYVKLSVMGPVGDLDVGKTKVLWDDDNPVYNHTFKLESVSISSTIFFEVFDKDMIGGDDYIGTVYIPVKRILSENHNGRPVKLDFPEGWLKVSVTWLVNEIET